MPLTGKGHRKKAKREQALAVAAAAAAQQQEEEEADVQQQQAEQAADDGDGGSAAESEEPQTAQPAVDSASLMREITATGRHFSKIAQQYRFDATAQGYVNWTVQFKAEMQFYDLADVLDQDPLDPQSAATDAADATLVRHKQKTVYHMILHCVPDAQIRAVVTTALPPQEQTGFGAWRALRARFIGDERAYLQSVESKFENLRWEEAESWATLETRFESLLTELATLGVTKMDHQRKGRLMGAIQESNRKDAQGSHVFDRLHTTNRIKEALPYHDWLVAMRTEAQRIQDELAKKGVKRAREESGEGRRDRAPLDAQEVSFVAGPAPSRPAAGPHAFAGTSKVPCRQWARNGRCSYGGSCKFSHGAQRGAFSSVGQHGSSGGGFRGQGSGTGRAGGNSEGNRTCWEFAATGRCGRGPQCHFRHAQTGGNAAAGRLDGAGSREVQFAEAYRVESDNIVLETVADGQGQRAHRHRVIADSAASVDLTPRRDFLRNLRPLPSPISIAAAFGKTAVATLCGDGHIPVGGGAVLVVPDMVLCEQLRDTLLCLVKLVKNGHQLCLGEDDGLFIDRSQTFAIPLDLDNFIITFRIDQVQLPGAKAEANATTRAMAMAQDDPQTDDGDGGEENAPSVAVQTHKAGRLVAKQAPAAGASVATSIPAASLLAHAQYGHLCGRKIDQLIEHQAADGLVVAHKHAAHKLLIANCDACMLAKMKRSAFGKEIDHAAQAPNDMVVADVVGPICVSVAAANGTAETAKFYLSMVTDVFSRHLRGLVMADKRPSDDVISYLHWSQVQTGRPLKRFHTDGGKEYNRAETVLESRGVKVTRTPVRTPQWNAIAERKNRTVLEMARSLLLHALLDPDVFWQFAVETAIFIHNRVTVVQPHGKTPHELFTGRKPDLGRFRVFGCDAFVRVSTEHPDKLSARAEKGVFVGYDSKREGSFRVWVEGRVVVSRDVQFSEQQFEVARRHSSSKAAAGGEPEPAAEAAGAQLQARIDRCLPTEWSPIVAAGQESESPAGAALQGQDPRPESGSQQHDQGPRSESGPQQRDQDPRSESGSDDESKVDARTMRKIAAAEKAAAKSATNSSSGSSNSSSIANSSNGNPKVGGGRRSMRERKAAKQSGLNPDDFGWSAFAVESKGGERPIRASEVSIPATRRAALRGPYASQWSAAMDAEYASIMEHGTWLLVDPPAEGVNLVSCKWVFAVKEKDGVVVRFKARLVARGFTQQYGVDYEETYASVVRFKAIRVLLAIVVMRDLTLELMDVQTAYLNAPLKERVFMRQPEGYERGGAASVCLLQKALYGLKQSGREWREHLDAFLVSVGFRRCSSDPCVYVLRSQRGHPILLCVYVDDIPAAFDEADRDEWEGIKRQFADKYKIKFLGEADWMLNMRIRRDRPRRLLWLDQQSYVASMLEEFQLDEARAVGHPGAQEELTAAGCPTTAEEAAQMKKVPYRRVVGLLTYLANCTRPDIAHAVNSAAQFAQNPGAMHWRGLMQILRYLCGTEQHALLFDGNAQGGVTVAAAPSASAAEGSSPSSSVSPLVVFADANWGNCKDTRRSVTGWLIRLGNSWVDWCCQKQATVALSSCEAEYMAVSAATQGAIWMQQLLEEMSFMEWTNGGDKSPPVPLVLCDNKSAIAMGHTDALHSRSKHIDIRHHFIREQIERGRIALQWISTQEQVADILTKTLQPRIFLRFRDQLVCVPQQQQKQRAAESIARAAEAGATPQTSPTKAAHTLVQGQ